MDRCKAGDTGYLFISEEEKIDPRFNSEKNAEFKVTIRSLPAALSIQMFVRYFLLKQIQ